MFEQLLQFSRQVVSTILVFIIAQIQPKALVSSNPTVPAAKHPAFEASASSQISSNFEPEIAPEKEPASRVALSPTQRPQQNVANYQLEPIEGGEEGHYVLKNVPNETMSTVDELNTAMNDYRAAHGLPRLNIDEQMCQIAEQRAIEANEIFSHEKFREHLHAGDYDFTGFRVMGENLFDGSLSGVHIVEYGWDQSPRHRPNMHRDWTRGCAGIYKSTAAYLFAK